MTALNFDDRVDSWKGIAAVLERDERTVQRWEKTRGLPVYRVPGERGAVFAYRSELRQWLHSVPQREIASADPAVVSSERDTLSGVEGDRAALEAGVARADSSRIVGEVHSIRSRWYLATAVALVVLLAGAGTLLRAGRLQRRPGKSPAVKDAREREFFQEGSLYWEQRTGASLQTALGVFQQYARAYPKSGDAYTGIAETYELMPEFGSKSPREAYPKALAAAQQAVALAPASADAHRVLAFAEFYWAWHVDQAMHEFQTSLALDPNNAETHHWYGNALLLLNRTAEADRELSRARDLDPKSRSIYADELNAEAWTTQGQADAVDKLKQLSASGSDLLSPSRYLLSYYFARQDYPSYLAALRELAENTHDEAQLQLAVSAEAAWRRGGEREMLSILRESEEQSFRRGESTGYHLAELSMALNDRPAAEMYLQAAYDRHDFMVLQTITRPKGFSMMAGDPGFEALEQKLRQVITAA